MKKIVVSNKTLHSLTVTRTPSGEKGVFEYFKRQGGFKGVILYSHTYNIIFDRVQKEVKLFFVNMPRVSEE